MKKLLIGILALAATTAAFGAEGMWMPQQIPSLAAELKKRAEDRSEAVRRSDRRSDGRGHLARRLQRVVRLAGRPRRHEPPLRLRSAAVQLHAAARPHHQRLSRQDARGGAAGRSRLAHLRHHEHRRRHDARLRQRSPPRCRTSTARRRIDRNVKQLVDECEKPGGVRCRVASFFEGAQYLRTTQMEIRDVRLVYAPALGIGDFGGETDNWMWPRHTGDWSYLRAYVGKDGKPADFSKDNVPYHPAHILKVSTESVNPGDFVLVAGYPGRTFRYRTAAEVGEHAELHLSDDDQVRHGSQQHPSRPRQEQQGRRDRERQPHQGQRQRPEELHRHADRLQQLPHRRAAPEAGSRSGRSTSPRIPMRRSTKT